MTVTRSAGPLAVAGPRMTGGSCLGCTLADRMLQSMGLREVMLLK